jgi:nucleoside phosphorylase/Tfp pilus assembly protein PilF
MTLIPADKFFTVGWICALRAEFDAARDVLDKHYTTLLGVEPDRNLYILGRIHQHNVVIACLPAGWHGNNPAATIATRMMSRFPSIKIGLLVGIGGGLPNKEDDIRLGDVVVSKPDGQYGGVVQYDLGKWTADGFERTGSLNAPPERLLAVLNLMPRHGRRFADPPSEPYPGEDLDQLFETDGQQLAKRGPGSRKNGPHVFYGTIASGNSVIKDADIRDKLIIQHGVLCCEMEAAGLMNSSFPCLVIRGISDYADAHKNDVWQDYAAATSAQYAKDFLNRIPDELEGNLPSVIPLHLGVVLGNEYVAGQLREMKGKLDMKDERGRTALHWAVIWRDEAVVRLLVDKEANIELRDNDGRTALWYAVTTRNEAVERILLDKGACLEVKDDDIDTVMRYATQLCDFYLRQDKLERGEEILRQALRAYEKNIQPDKPIDIGHQATLTRINSLANLYNQRGKFRKAEELYQLQIDGCKKAFGLDDERTLRRMRDLGYFYLSQDKPDEADGMLLQALQGYEGNIQPDKPIDSGHEVTLIHINSLADLYNERGKFRKAEELYQLEIDGCKKALGPDDKRTLSRIRDLGAFYLSQDKPDEAEGMLLQALQGYEKNFQPAKPIDISYKVTLNHINDLADLYNERGKFRKAEELYQLEIDGCKKALGLDDEETLNRMGDLGGFYMEHGRMMEAENMYQLAVDGLRKALGPDNRETLSRIRDLGAFYLSQDKPDEAEGMLLQALQGYEKNIQPDKPIDICLEVTLNHINDLADLYNQRGKFRKAEELYQLQIDGCKKAFGLDDERTLRRMRDLGYFYLSQDKPDEAEGMLLQALQGYEKNFQPAKPIDISYKVTLNHINSLAGLYKERGKFKKAKELYQLEINGCKQALGPDDERTLSRTRDLRNLKKELRKLKASQAAIAPMGGDGNAIAPQAAPTSHSLVSQNSGTAEASHSGSRRGDHYSERRHERRKRSGKKNSDTRRSRNDDNHVGTPLKPAEQKEETDGGVEHRTKHKEEHGQPQGQHVHRGQYRKRTGRLNLAQRLLAQSKVSLGL